MPNIPYIVCANLNALAAHQNTQIVEPYGGVICKCEKPEFTVALIFDPFLLDYIYDHIIVCDCVSTHIHTNKLSAFK